MLPITVAAAAPATPQPNTRIKRGSRTIFVTVPARLPYMPSLTAPSALRSIPMEEEISINTVPQERISR